MSLLLPQNCNFAAGSSALVDASGAPHSWFCTFEFFGTLILILLGAGVCAGDPQEVYALGTQAGLLSPSVGVWRVHRRISPSTPVHI